MWVVTRWQADFIIQIEVKMMDTFFTMHPVRFMLIAIAAVTLMILSVFAFASPS